MNRKTKQITKEAEQEIEIPCSTIKKVLQIIFFSVLLFSLNVGAKSPALSSSTTNKFVVYKENKLDLSEFPNLVRGRINEKLVEEVKTYIKNMAPSSNIDPVLLTTMSQKYNLDITFVLAQGLLESHFGTKGRASVTNSIFNVGAWDNGKIIYSYKHVNESIEPYMQLLKNEYLINKEVPDLIQDREYKNINGHRYATSINYEQSLRTLIANINMQTSIKMYEGIIKLSDEEIITYFAPSEEKISDTELHANLK